MCINFETSMIAFLIGEISGFILFLSNNIYKKYIGLFIMFFSLVQILEALIYKGYDYNGIFSKILLINLGLQGTIFFYLINKIDPTQKIYLYICGIISIIIISRIFFTDFKKASINTCLKWNFMDNINKKILNIMYLLIFLYSFTSNIYFITISALILLITYIISCIIKNENSPSMWCLFSALVSPLIIFL